ncbi:hypothetical protein BKA65DRAFT_159393 [Rhexocercosporidium sp. MPI-PUGE-AT-0058]|nr:hypothetical protein BKA65DRAFT_159393 [Rhexocercosporidium sp. MPI-PUGE-AT-0058]
MVNHGASAACQTCKKRKIKCDQTRPSCQRCEKIGKQCPGYLDDWDINFRSENDALRAKAAVQQRPADEKSAAPSMLEVFGAGSSRSCTPSTAVYLSDQLVDNIHQHAISLFFQDYTIESCGRCPGYLDYLPQLYGRSNRNSLLTVALLAVAHANIAQKLERQDIAIKAMSYYRKALRLANAVLAKNVEATSDNTMTAIMLLGLYECINTTISEVEATQHTQGLVILLDIRLEVLAEGPSLLQTVCCQMQRRNLDFRLPPRPIHARLISFLDISKPANQMILSMMHVSKWVAEVHLVILVGNPNLVYQDLVRDFAVLEEELCQWNKSASISLSYQKVRSEDSSNETKHDNYSGFWSVGVWNKHRATRILLHQLLLELFQAVREGQPSVNINNCSLNQLRQNSQNIIQEMTGDILASVPFSLGEMSFPPKSVGGYFLVWSLQTIIRCPFTSLQQNHEALAMLARVGRQCGIKCATMIAKNSQNYDLYKKDITIQFSESSVLSC